MNTDDLTDEQLEQILNSPIVRKYVAYRSLTDGIEALKDDEGVMYQNFLDGVHSRVGRLSKDSVENVIDAVVEEVEANTAFVEDVEGEGEELLVALADEQDE